MAHPPKKKNVELRFRIDLDCVQPLPGERGGGTERKPDALSLVSSGKKEKAESKSDTSTRYLLRQEGTEREKKQIHTHLFHHEREKKQ